MLDNGFVELLFSTKLVISFKAGGKKAPHFKLVLAATAAVTTIKIDEVMEKKRIEKFDNHPSIKNDWIQIHTGKNKTKNSLRTFCCVRRTPAISIESMRE